MNIYKLTDPTVKVGYQWGCYLTCVVVAESEEQARLIHPDSNKYVTYKWENDTWKYKMNYSKDEEWCRSAGWKINQLVVELIGVADPSITEIKVINSEFSQ